MGDVPMFTSSGPLHTVQSSPHHNQITGSLSNHPRAGASNPSILLACPGLEERVAQALSIQGSCAVTPGTADARPLCEFRACFPSDVRDTKALVLPYSVCDVVQRLVNEFNDMCTLRSPMTGGGLQCEMQIICSRVTSND